MKKSKFLLLLSISFLLTGCNENNNEESRVSITKEEAYAIFNENTNVSYTKADCYNHTNLNMTSTLEGNEINISTETKYDITYDISDDNDLYIYQNLYTNANAMNQVTTQIEEGEFYKLNDKYITAFKEQTYNQTEPSLRANYVPEDYDLTVLKSSVTNTINQSFYYTQMIEGETYSGVNFEYFKEGDEIIVTSSNYIELLIENVINIILPQGLTLDISLTPTSKECEFRFNEAGFINNANLTFEGTMTFTLAEDSFTYDVNYETKVSGKYNENIDKIPRIDLTGVTIQ